MVQAFQLVVERDIISHNTEVTTDVLERILCKGLAIADGIRVDAEDVELFMIRLQSPVESVDPVDKEGIPEMTPWKS